MVRDLVDFGCEDEEVVWVAGAKRYGATRSDTTARDSRTRPEV